MNGLTASIELYFGSDVLSRSDGTIAPVQWEAYIQSFKSYQGEVTEKDEPQAAFDPKLSALEKGPAMKAQQD